VYVCVCVYGMVVVCVWAGGGRGEERLWCLENGWWVRQQMAGCGACMWANVGEDLPDGSEGWRIAGRGGVLL
jgi:hypothetical protein